MNYRRAEGVVLVVALLLTLMLSVLGAAFALVMSSEAVIAENFRNGQEALHAAEAATERAIGDLDALASWDPALDGTERSTFVDGLPSGSRTLPGGSVLDLMQVSNLANCHKTTSCTASEMDASTADRPWGPNNPRWQLFLYGWLRDVAGPDLIKSAYYIVVLVGDDPSETDNDPSRDSRSPDPGAGVVVLRSHAFGPRGVRKTIEVTISRSSSGHVRVIAWRPS
jgi:type IV pilus assembly PilX-like protein